MSQRGRKRDLRRTMFRIYRFHVAKVTMGSRRLFWRVAMHLWEPVGIFLRVAINLFPLTYLFALDHVPDLPFPCGFICEGWHRTFESLKISERLFEYKKRWILKFFNKVSVNHVSLLGVNLQNKTARCLVCNVQVELELKDGDTLPPPP